MKKSPKSLQVIVLGLGVVIVTFVITSVNGRCVYSVGLLASGAAIMASGLVMFSNSSVFMKIIFGGVMAAVIILLSAFIITATTTGCIGFG